MSSSYCGLKVVLFCSSMFLICALLTVTQAYLTAVPIDYYNRQQYQPYRNQAYKPYENTYASEAKMDYWNNKQSDPWGIKKPLQPQQQPQPQPQRNSFVPVAQTDWNRQQYNPSNVHSSFYTDYGDCDPWCRAHCATKRTPDFCYLAGPCLNNCYRIVTNFLRSRRM